MASTRLPTSIFGTLRTASHRPSAIWKQRCLYHSYDYAQPPPFPPAETAILSSAYSHVPSHGFTIDALKLGARDAGYLDVSTNLLPRGVFDLVNYHLVTQRLALQSSVQFPGDGANGKRIGIGSKVRTLTLARLRANDRIINRWQEVGTSVSLQWHNELNLYRRLQLWPSHRTFLLPLQNWRDSRTRSGSSLAMKVWTAAGIRNAQRYPRSTRRRNYT